MVSRGGQLTEITSHNAVPGRVVLFVELLLDVGGDVLLDVVLLKSLLERRGKRAVGSESVLRYFEPRSWAAGKPLSLSRFGSRHGEPIRCQRSHTHTTRTLEASVNSIRKTRVWLLFRKSLRPSLSHTLGTPPFRFEFRCGAREEGQSGLPTRAGHAKTSPNPVHSQLN